MRNDTLNQGAAVRSQLAQEHSSQLRQVTYELVVVWPSGPRAQGPVLIICVTLGRSLALSLPWFLTIPTSEDS